MNRDISRYARRLCQVPQYLWYFIKCFALFKRPLRFIRCYLTVASPAEAVVECRSGLKIYLSGHPHDVVTIFLVFVRRDYGDIDPRTPVVDIGANIGVFSLFAARCGARKVYAYEPNGESFRCLTRNIEANGLGSLIEARRAAVTAVDGDRVRFPRESSPYNAIIRNEGPADCELVDTASLSAALADAELGSLLKLDCEGSEYDILLQPDCDALRKVDRIRMEFHSGRVRELERGLNRCGFRQTRCKADTETSGTVWYARKN